MRESVLAVFCADDEMFIIERSDALEVFPGYYSFPGGKVDAGESPRDALVREVEEELGYDLESAREVLSLDKYAEATTPVFMPHRFRSHFFLVRLRQKVDFPFFSGEIKRGYWDEPRKIYGDYLAARALMVPSTVALVRNFCRGVGEGGSIAFDYDERRTVPVIEPLGGVLVFLPFSNAIAPVDRTNAFLVGDEGSRRVLVDPSPRDGRELEKFLRTLSPYHIDEIFLTHHHHKDALAVARELRVGLSMSEGTLGRIGGGWDGGVRLLGDGDTLTRSGGEDVVVVAVPGRDGDQLAARTSKWMIVGGLVWSGGTVAVWEDMALYLRSLQKVIDLDPPYIFPSHGPALGGTYKVRRTFEHRMARERQIRDLLGKGQDVDGIVRTLYGRLDPRLLEYARVTIQSHIDKIRCGGG